MAETVLDQDATWAQVVERVGRIQAAAKMGLRALASVNALADSCVSASLHEIGPCRFEDDEARYLHTVAKYAAALALTRYSELLPHDRAALEEAVSHA